jgi:hypothetical protein
MSNTVTVRAHERKKPAKKPDPLQPMIDARRSILEARWKPSLERARADARVNQFRDEIGFISWVRRMLGRK